MRPWNKKFYGMLIAAGNAMQPAFLVVVRLYWGWQFVQTGGGRSPTCKK